jgi:hypothetical protein
MIRGVYILTNLKPVEVWVDLTCEDEIGNQIDAEDMGLTDFNKLCQRGCGK